MIFDDESKRVVIYARVSTEHEEQISALNNQLDWYRPILAARPDWDLVGQYIDEGITGTSAQKRPQFMKMIADAKRNKFDMIITREVSRFARNTVDTLQYTRELKALGVEVFFINDNIKTFDNDGELRLTIMATLAQDESRKTSVRVKSGQQTSMQNGVYYGNGNILGYDRVGKTMVKNPEQAATVRLIYDLYLKGWGLIKIKDELERQGRLTATGNKNWHCAVITHVLKNTFYYGLMTYHKEYTPDYLTQKKIRNKGKIEYVQVMGTHEPIVTKEEFDKVQAILESKRNANPQPGNGNLGRGKTPRTTVWGKLLECSCGHKFSMRVWTRYKGKVTKAYQCYSSVQSGSYKSRLKRGLPTEGICRSPMIPEWKLQLTANYIFRHCLTDKDKVLSLAKKILASHIHDKNDKELLEIELKAKTKTLKRLSKKLDSYIDMRSDGEITKDVFRLKTKEIEPEINVLQQEIAELEKKLDEKVPDINECEEKLQNLFDTLEGYLTPGDKDVAPGVIEAFVQKIVISEDGMKWYMRTLPASLNPILPTVKGRNKTNAEVSVQKEGNFLPAPLVSGAGCYEGKTENVFLYQIFFYCILKYSVRFSCIYSGEAEKITYQKIFLYQNNKSGVQCAPDFFIGKTEEHYS